MPTFSTICCTATIPLELFWFAAFAKRLFDIGFIFSSDWRWGLVRPHPAPRLQPLFDTGAGGILLVQSISRFSHWGRWYSFVVPAGTLVGIYASITSFRVIHRRARETENPQDIFSISFARGDRAD